MKPAARKPKPCKRWRVQSDDDGGFDELTLAGGLVHLEMMDRNVCWVKIGEQACSINLRTKRVAPWERYR